MAAIIREPVYRDLDFRFTRHPVTGKLNVLKNRDAVKQAVKLLIMTNRLERPFRPLLGSTVRAQLFELFDGMTEEDVKRAIEEAIHNHEPRVALLAVTVAADPDGGSLLVTIVFRPINSVETVSTTIEIERVR